MMIALARRQLVGLLAVGLLSSPFTVAAKAATITRVFAPLTLQRPADDRLYPFEITVSGFYDAADFVPRPGRGLDFPAEYWDQDGAGLFDIFIPDDPIHLLRPPLGGLSLTPPGSATKLGDPWFERITFLVGCARTPEVFGPSGRTGEDPMDDGYFYFHGTTNAYWGYNTVTCVSSPGSPTNGDPVLLKPVPEPSSIGLVAGAVLTLVLRKSLKLPRRPNQRA